MRKNGFYLVLMCFTITVTAFVCLSRYDTVKAPDTDEPPTDIIIRSKEVEPVPEDAEIKDAEPENISASTDSARVTKYILKYDENEVVLICIFANGKKTESTMPDINIDYLTEIDREQLISGIELTDEEELYKLIEDYSS